MGAPVITEGPSGDVTRSDHSSLLRAAHALYRSADDADRRVLRALLDAAGAGAGSGRAGVARTTGDTAASSLIVENPDPSRSWSAAWRPRCAALTASDRHRSGDRADTARRHRRSGEELRVSITVARSAFTNLTC
jgi:hypothetical protein